MVKRSLNEFLNWWLTGLGYLVPEALKDRLGTKKDHLFVIASRDNLHFRLVRRDGATDEWSMARGDDLATANTRRRIGGNIDIETIVTVLLAEEDVLAKRFSLPLAAADNLNEVLGYEMDRQTPFSIDQVYFDWRELGRNPDSGRINIELIVVLKSFLEPLLQEIQALHLQPRLISVNRSDYRDINLLPSAGTAGSLKQTNKVTLTLGGLAVTLLLAALYIPLMHYQSGIEGLQERVNTLRHQAKAAQILLEERNNMLARTRFLENKRRLHVPVLDILLELTTVLPDDTWVSRLILHDGELQIYGESESATSIIQLIEDSNMFSNANFAAPVTKNPRSRKDRYQVSASIENSEDS